MILGRLFEGFLKAGVVVVATSNFAPDDLYMNWPSTNRFLPFIDLIKERLDILELASPTDYRQARLSRMQVYHTPLNTDAHHAIDLAFAELTEGARIETESLTVKAERSTCRNRHAVWLISNLKICASKHWVQRTTLPSAINFIRWFSAAYRK